MTRPWGPGTPAGAWDVVVIGAGIGGLSAAGLLAQLGRRVLVVEQHAVPGGFTQSFRRGGWAWDVGLHVVGEMGPRCLFGRVVDALAGGRLKWKKIDGAYDVAELPSGKEVLIPGSLSGLRQSLLAAFPGEAPAIARYFTLMREASAAMRDYFVARSLTPWLQRTTPGPTRALALATTAQVLDGLTQNADLRAVLAVHWVFYGTPPERSNFGTHALLARHYRQGGYYPLGGSMSIPRALSAALREHGGWVKVRADVARIDVTHGHATGVTLRSGEQILAPTVVSAAGALNTLRLLPPEERAQAWVDPVEALPPSCAHVSLYVGFKGDIAAAGASATNRYLMNGREELWDGASERPLVYVNFPSLKDGVDHGPDQLHTAEVVALTAWEPFARFDGSRWRHRGAEYDAVKAKITKTLLDLLLKRLPKLRPLVAYTELSTPVSTAHFARGVRGAAYGLESTAQRFENRWLRPRTPVKGLHLAGCDVAVIGVAGALVGGLAAAVSVDPERAGLWLREAVR